MLQQALALLTADILSKTQLSADTVAAFTQQFALKQYKSRQVLIYPGDHVHSLWYVTQGYLRAYSSNGVGQEHVIQLAMPGWWITDLNSFRNHVPANFAIETLTNVAALHISSSQLEQTLLQYPELERFFRILAENAYIAAQQRIVQNFCMDAESRFKAFLDKYPSLFHQIPQKHIASYIGVTPEHFSKMRTRLLHKS